MIDYIPSNREWPKMPQSENMWTSWGDIPSIIKQLIEDFQLNNKKALEFGVEYGYSTAAFANYFETVTGVDTFTGDMHSGFKENHINITKDNLKDFYNINLIQADYREFISKHNQLYDLIHIDIIHTYEDTYICGEWSVNHAKLTVFHDTESFPDVKNVCLDLSKKYKLPFLNYKPSHGLGIIYNGTINT